MKWLIVPTTILLLITAGCAGTPQLTLNPYNTGMEFIQAVIDAIQSESGWAEPLPPQGGQAPRVLTAEEKGEILEIAGSFYAVNGLEQNRDVISVSSDYLWIGWNGNANGAASLNYQPIEDGLVSPEAFESIGDTCFPAVSYRFHSKYGDSGIAGILIAVNLDTGKIVFIRGFCASSIIPSKLVSP